MKGKNKQTEKTKQNKAKTKQTNKAKTKWKGHF